jgi:hypothetical protein
VHRAVTAIPKAHDPFWRTFLNCAKRDSSSERVLALQLHFLSEVSAASVGLVSTPPERPCENTVDRDAPLSELDGDAADFLD